MKWIFIPSVCVYIRILSINISFVSINKLFISVFMSVHENDIDIDMNLILSCQNNVDVRIILVEIKVEIKAYSIIFVCITMPNCQKSSICMSQFQFFSLFVHVEISLYFIYSIIYYEH